MPNCFSLSRKGDDRHGACETAMVPEPLELADWLMDSICETPDGCEVEPDGACEHGYQSWLLILGLM